MIHEINVQTKETSSRNWKKAEKDALEKGVKADEKARSYIERRAEDYPNIGDQLDAIWKTLNQWRLEGKELPQDGDDMLNAVLAVKKKHPKPSKS